MARRSRLMKHLKKPLRDSDRGATPLPCKLPQWNCINCGDRFADEVTEEHWGDQSFVYCNQCGYRSVSRIQFNYKRPTPAPRPKRYCYFIKAKDGDIHKPLDKYSRCAEIFLALRIGYFKEAWRLMCGKRSNYIWEGNENNPFPF